MDARDFETVRKQLLEAGLKEDGPRYDESAFGSWFVVIERNPRLRVVWDGKDGRLTMQRQRVEGEWEDLWVAEAEADQTLAGLMQAITSV